MIGVPNRSGVTGRLHERGGPFSLNCFRQTEAKTDEFHFGLAIATKASRLGHFDEGDEDHESNRKASEEE
jgi:hypothetical protein